MVMYLTSVSTKSTVYELDPKRGKIGMAAFFGLCATEAERFMEKKAPTTMDN